MCGGSFGEVEVGELASVIGEREGRTRRSQEVKSWGEI
jgi:hypothetical protein